MRFEGKKIEKYLAATGWTGSKKRIYFKILKTIVTDLRTYFVVNKSYKQFFYLQNSRRNRLFATKYDSVLKLVPDWSSNQWSPIIFQDARFLFKYYTLLKYWVLLFVVFQILGPKKRNIIFLHDGYPLNIENIIEFPLFDFLAVFLKNIYIHIQHIYSILERNQILDRG